MNINKKLKPNKIFKISNFILLDFKNKTTLFFLATIILIIIYNLISNIPFHDLFNHKQKNYSQTIINQNYPNIDDKYIRPKPQINYSSLYAIMTSYKQKNNPKSYNLLKEINEKQAILVRNLIDIDLYQYLNQANISPSLNYNDLIFVNSINYNNIKNYLNQNNKYFVLNNEIISENCSENYCNYNMSGNQFYNFNIFEDNLSSINNYNKYKEYSTIFVCKNISIDVNNPEQLIFSNCLYEKNYINEYANNLSELLKTYPDYLTEKAKHLIYTALIGYFYIDENSICYMDNIEYYNEKNQCLNELELNLSSAKNLKTSFSNFTLNSVKYQNLLNLSLSNNKDYRNYSLENIILEKIEKQLPKSLTPSQRIELVYQLNQLYIPGDNINDSKASNIRNYNLNKIYSK